MSVSSRHYLMIYKLTTFMTVKHVCYVHTCMLCECGLAWYKRAAVFCGSGVCVWGVCLLSLSTVLTWLSVPV